MASGVDEKRTTKESIKRMYEGTVVSDKMDKTIVVQVVRLFRHPLFDKTVRKFKKYKAHDEQNQARIGDLVEIVETTPRSKDKHTELVRVISSGERALG
jgi:small subunit ribosomal protein S17